MSSNLEHKKEVVAQLNEMLTDAKSVVLVQYQGTTANVLNDCRGLARAQNVKLKITKNKVQKFTIFLLLKLSLDKLLVFFSKF